MTPAAAFDFQKPDLEAWFWFVGIETVHSIVAERMLGKQGGLSCEQAVSDATALARRRTRPSLAGWIGDCLIIVLMVR